MADMERAEMNRLIVQLSHIAGVLGTLPLERLMIALRLEHEAREGNAPGPHASRARYWALMQAARAAGNYVDYIETAMAQHRAAIAAYAEADQGPAAGAVVIPLRFGRKPVPDASA